MLPAVVFPVLGLKIRGVSLPTGRAPAAPLARGRSEVPTPAAQPAGVHSRPHPARLVGGQGGEGSGGHREQLEAEPGSTALLEAVRTSEAQEGTPLPALGCFSLKCAPPLGPSPAIEQPVSQPCCVSESVSASSRQRGSLDSLPLGAAWLVSWLRCSCAYQHQKGPLPRNAPSPAHRKWSMTLMSYKTVSDLTEPHFVLATTQTVYIPPNSKLEYLPSMRLCRSSATRR